MLALLKSLPWIPCLLSLGILITTGIYSSRVAEEKQHINNIFDILNVTATDKAKDIVINGLTYFVAVAWVLTTVAVLGTVASFIIKFVVVSRQSSSGRNIHETGCVRTGTAAILMGIILVLSYITTVLSVAQISLQVLVLAALKTVSTASGGAQGLVEKGVQDITKVVDLLQTGTVEVQSIITSLSGCAAPECTSTVGRLNVLNAGIASALNQLNSNSTGSTCPSNCVDLGQLFFVEGSTDSATSSCFCDSAKIVLLKAEADDGFNAAIGAAVAVLLTFLLWLIFFGHISMSLKGLLKDQECAQLLRVQQNKLSFHERRDQIPLENSAQLPPNSGNVYVNAHV